MKRLDHQVVASEGVWEQVDYIVQTLDQDLAEEADYLRALLALGKATAALGQLGDELRFRVESYFEIHVDSDE